MITRSNREINFAQSARGSFVYDGKDSHLGVRNTGSVGKSGLLILPYLDTLFNQSHALLWVQTGTGNKRDPENKRN